MAPTAAMLLLSHNGKTHAPSMTMLPSSSSSSATTTYSRLKDSALKWVAKYNPVPKVGSENNMIQTQTVVHPSAVGCCHGMK
ncbi:hypothetical protein CR513_43445, partial [Mucuna pruriens]